MAEKRTHDDFVKLIKEKFKNIDVSSVVYINNTTKCDFICNKHGLFSKTPKDILKKSSKGCPMCAKESRTISFEDSEKRFNEIHNNSYTYDKTSFVNYSTKMKIKCEKHGYFYQKPSEHLKYGCIKCYHDVLKQKSIDNLEIKKETKRLMILNKNEKHLQDLTSKHDGKYEYDVVLNSDLKLKTRNKIKIICEDHGVFEQKLNNHKNGRGCPKCANNGKPSKKENELYEFIINIKSDAIQSHKINNIEIDIFIPSLNLGIEFNGLYWHSDKFKKPDYHLKKTDYFKHNNIRLIHIFEDEYDLKKEIVLSRLKNILGSTDSKIYARNCTIKEISPEESKKFLNDNHIQGNVNSKIKIGLYQNDDLKAIMTLGHLRKALGSDNKEGEYELLRYCNKLNTVVVGGASKLFKYFIKKYNPVKVTSYADRRWSNGEMYYKLGFNLEKQSRPNYFYVDQSFNVRQNRFKFRKDILVKKGYDINKTEKQIMSELKFNRIYDCGAVKFIYE